MYIYYLLIESKLQIQVHTGRAEKSSLSPCWTVGQEARARRQQALRMQTGNCTR